MEEIGYVYILECKNKRYYVGSTKDIERRYQEHSAGKSPATKNVLPVKLLFFCKFPNIQEARKMETYLKKQKSRKVIENFMNTESPQTD